MNINSRINQLYTIDNLTLLKSIPDNTIDLIYGDILYGTGRTFDDFKDLHYDIDSINEFYDERIKEIQRILKPSGTMVLQMDFHISHWLRTISDNYFGYKNCVNVVQWQYSSGGSSKKKLSQKNDELIIYAKDSKLQKFNIMKERSYNRGMKPYRFKGVEEFEDENGNWYTLVNMKCIWNIPMVGRTSKERVNYNTQKPIRLMDRIRDLYTNEGDIIFDICCGSGGMVVSAKKGNRKYIACDINRNAIKITQERIDKIWNI